MNSNVKFLSIGMFVFIIVGSGFFLVNKNTQNEPVTQANEKAVTIRITTSSTTINPWAGLPHSCGIWNE